MFSTPLKAVKIILSAFKLQFANAFKLDQSTNLSYGNALNLILLNLQTAIPNLMKMALSSLNDLENIVGKGEIAHYRQFLLFSMFSKDLYFKTHKNKSLFGEE